MSLTKLDAVNRMLEAIGEDPVSSLASGVPEAASAERFLDRVNHDVQEAGWHCNTDFDYQLTLESDGTILITSDVLRFDTMSEDRYRNVTERTLNSTRLMYDVDNRTTTFTASPKLQIIREFSFENVTPVLQIYIAAKAVVDYQVSELGSVNLDAFSVRKRDEAWIQLLDAELENEDANPLAHNQSLYWATQRNSPVKYGHL